MTLQDFLAAIRKADLNCNLPLSGIVHSPHGEFLVCARTALPVAGEIIEYLMDILKRTSEEEGTEFGLAYYRHIERTIQTKINAARPDAGGSVA